MKEVFKFKPERFIPENPLSDFTLVKIAFFIKYTCAEERFYLFVDLLFPEKLLHNPVSVNCDSAKLSEHRKHSALSHAVIPCQPSDEHRIIIHYEGRESVRAGVKGYGK